MSEGYLEGTKSWKKGEAVCLMLLTEKMQLLLVVYHHPTPRQMKEGEILWLLPFSHAPVHSLSPTGWVYLDASWQERADDVVILLGRTGQGKEENGSGPQTGQRLVWHVKGCGLCHKMKVNSSRRNQRERSVSIGGEYSC